MVKYLVRPHDFMIFEIDPSNECYRGYETKEVKNRPNAMSHFTYEILTNSNHEFFPITEDQIEEYKLKHNAEMEFTIWQHRNDGHGGCKGGTREEYEAYLERVKRFKMNIPETIEHYASKNIYIEIVCDAYQLNLPVCYRSCLTWKKDDEWVEDDCGCFREWKRAFDEAVELAEMLENIKS